ncbi:hNH endonuclease [Escherichia coli]|uniref:hNH endonuclease n=1 Tax=Escherichia coli TaxID=562 RepID=UPI002026DE7D|nr:hNH endonuclease [Escherichia coli]
MKQMTLIEMDGFLKGKCIPCDLKVNETNAEYLVRKFGELESKLETALRECRSAGITIDNLEAKCAALTAENGRYSMSAGQADQRMAESRAVRSALGFQEDADDVSPSDLVEKIQSLITEQEILRSAHPQPLGPIMDLAIDAFNSAEMPETGMLNAFFILRDSIIVKTPVTDAFLAEVRAQEVDMARNAMIDFVDGEVGPNKNVPGLIRGAEICVSIAEQLRKGGDQ